MGKIIMQSTDERMKEIKNLFNTIKPFLDSGDSFGRALVKIGKIKQTANFNSRTGWGRDLIDYAKEKGYNYKDFKMHYR